MSLSSHLSPRLCSIMASSPYTQLLFALSLLQERILPESPSPSLTMVGFLRVSCYNHLSLRKPKATVGLLIGLSFNFTENLPHR